MVINVEKLMKRRHAIRKRAFTDIDESKVALQSSDTTPIVLQSHLDVLEHHKSVLAEMNNTIWNELDDNNVDNEDVLESEDIQVRLISCISMLASTVAKIDRQESQRNDAASVGNDNINTVPNGNATNQSNSRLPTLDLPRFNGDPLKWHVFWDAYDASIHSRMNLQNVEKFSYLRSLLKGVAADSITGIATTNANYDTAIDIIRERFGQKQTVINANVDMLTNLARSTEDTSKLRTLYDQFEIHIRGLESLGVTASDGVILTSILFNKLPAEVRLLLTEKNQKQIGDLDSLRKLLRTHIEAREVSQFSKKGSTRTAPDESRFTTGTLLTTAKEQGPREPFCAFCQAHGHWSNQCNAYKTVGERSNVIKEKRLCGNCLYTGHYAKECRSRNRCKHCNKRHNTLICQENASPGGNKRNVDISNNVAVNPAPTATTEISPSLVSNSTAIWMQTAQAKVFDNYGQSHVVRILFDTGSHRSYVSESLSRKLQLRTEFTEILSIAPFGQQKSSPRKFNIVSVNCHSCDQSKKHCITAVVTPTITSPIYRTPATSNQMFQGLQLADPPSNSDEALQIDVLVGLDHYWQIVNGQALQLNGSGMTAVHSIFGWLVSGNMRNDHNNTKAYNTLLVGTCNDPSDNLLTKFWDTENIPDNMTSQDEQDIVLNHFNKTITKFDGRYQVCLPWKDEPVDLPDNYGLAKTRFRRLVIKLNKEDLISQYQDVIQQQLERNFIEPVDHNSELVGTLHYISHHPVVRKDHATTKLRVVYDASAKKSAIDPSLNECLYTGPNIIGDLMPLLMEFRFQDIVLLADIEKAFLQVALHPKDRDATRFFWLKDPSKPAFDNNIQVYRFCRVLFGATCSPFLLAATIKFHLSHSTNLYAKKMVDKFYVDNLVSGCENITEAIAFYKEAKQIMTDAGMNLREWISNSSEVMEKIPPEDRASGPEVKVLGLQWNINEDCIKVKGVPRLTDTHSQTKRAMLQTIARIFDPLGLVTPVVISAKIFIQELWKLKLAWDGNPPLDKQITWNHINEQLEQLSEVKLQRRIHLNAESSLHVFVDASPKAYGAVVYCHTPGHGTQIVCSKSRVAPIKDVSIPRLELMAAVLGVKLLQSIRTLFDKSQHIQMWSDSQVVLYWIRNQGSKEKFVNNRLRVINESGLQFRYCPTKDNPADWISRGKPTDDLCDPSCIWWKGPAWISQERDWPEDIPAKKLIQSEENSSVLINNQMVHKTSKDVQSPFDIDPKRYSSLSKLFRVTGICISFIDRLRKRRPTYVESDTLQQASRMWIRYIQRSRFNEQYKLLKRNKSSNVIKQMNLFLENDIIKTKGRLAYAAVKPETNTPVLLPKNHHITDLIIKDIHQQLMHQGVSHTLAVIREQYWIPSGRQQVRSVLKKCYVCLKWEGRSYSAPFNSLSLPPFRMTMSPPFTYVGCDFAGPLTVYKEGSASKTYICLFTCAVTRAIHLELIESMSTTSFLMALRRFVARRGIPQEIITDNAKTFKQTDVILSKVWSEVVNDNETLHYVASKGIKWRYIIERAPWWGGFYERLVGLTKRALLKSIQKSKLTYIELNTVLVEIEAILNTRPLTHVSNDIDGEITLQPCNFLTQSKHFSIPTVHLEKDPDYGTGKESATRLIERLRMRQKNLDRFWKLWEKDYLTSLREIHHRNNKGKLQRNRYLPEIGDVVLVKQDGTKRAHWKLAVVQELFISSDDGQTRAAKLKMHGKVFQRPINHLYPLEVHSSIKDDDSATPVSDERTRKTTQRTTAIKARQRIKELQGDQSHPSAGV